MTTDQPTAIKTNRRWHQYSLRTLLIFVTLFAVACSWFTVKMQHAKRQREAVEAIMQLGGLVLYDYETFQYKDSVHISGSPIIVNEPSTPLWLRNLLGRDFFYNVITVLVYSENGLDYIESLTQIENLYLIGASSTDATLSQLNRLTKLQTLYLYDSQVTDAGLVNLEGLTNLILLDLNNTPISDAGLENLKRFTKLQTLDLHKTKVTDAGVQDLQKALPKLKIVR
jgi:hypothetical protein